MNTDGGKDMQCPLSECTEVIIKEYGNALCKVQVVNEEGEVQISTKYLKALEFGVVERFEEITETQKDGTEVKRTLVYLDKHSKPFDIEDVRNRMRFSCVKWRRGGDQPDKLLKVKETIDYIFTKGFTTRGVFEFPEVSKLEKPTKGMGLLGLKSESDHLMGAADIRVTD